jgi:flagellar basal body rod protein FlgC
MDAVSGIAASGLRSAEVRFDAAASSIAGAGTSPAAPFAASPSSDGKAVQVDLGTSNNPDIVAAPYAPKYPAYGMVYDPTSPHADITGMVEVPVSDSASDLVTATLAKYQFLAAVKIDQIGGHVQDATLDILA